VTAVLTALDMAAEGRRAALLDGCHHLELAEADVPSIGSSPGGAVVMEDVGDLQPWAAHGRRTTLRFSTSLRSVAQGGRAGWSRCGSSYWRRGMRLARGSPNFSRPPPRSPVISPSRPLSTLSGHSTRRRDSCSFRAFQMALMTLMGLSERFNDCRDTLRGSSYADWTCPKLTADTFDLHPQQLY
jgi:hypothetical protein